MIQIIEHLKTFLSYFTIERFFLGIFQNFIKQQHCVKRVRIQGYSGPYFPAFELNRDQNNSEYGHFLRSAIPE